MIEIELILVLIFAALCVIAYRLKRSNELATKCEQHLSILRKSREQVEPLPPPLKLTREDIQPRRESVNR